MEVAALRDQMDKAKVDSIAALRISRPFFDECGVFYGDGFHDCLKQVTAVYLNLDLSQIAIDDTVPPTLGGPDAVSDEVDDSTHTVEDEVGELETGTVDQPAKEKTPYNLVSPLDLFALEASSTKDQSSSKAS